MGGEGQLIMFSLGCNRCPNEKPPPACGRGFHCLTQFKPLGLWLRLFEDGKETTSLQQDNR
jgi:hypothetical protein